MADPTVPPLVIENGNWGATSLRTIRGVLTSAAQVLLAGFGSVPDAAIHVAPWRRNPQVFHDRRPYQVRLSARDTYWCQYVYQFAHELCHVMINFDRHRTHRHRTSRPAASRQRPILTVRQRAERRLVCAVMAGGTQMADLEEELATIN